MQRWTWYFLMMSFVFLFFCTTGYFFSFRFVSFLIFLLPGIHFCSCFSFVKNVGGILAPSDARSLAWHRDVVIDTGVPVIEKVTSPLDDGRYGAGEAIFIDVHFSKAVVVASGIPKLELTATSRFWNQEAAGDYRYRVATFVAGSGTSVLTFRYDVVDGDFSPHLNYRGTLALYDQVRAAAAAGETVTILSHSSNPMTPANLRLPVSEHTLAHHSILYIDTTAPTVVAVETDMPDGTYGLGSVLSFRIRFSDPVVIVRDDLCYVELQTNTNELGRGYYVAGSQTHELEFHYAVLAGHASQALDVKDTRDAAVGLEISTALKCFPPCYVLRQSVHPTTRAVLALPVPGARQSLSFGRKLVVAGVPPHVEKVTMADPDGVYGVGAKLTLLVVFSAPVVVRGEPVLLLNILNQHTPAQFRAPRYATFAGVSGGQTLRFEYEVVEAVSFSISIFIILFL
jgi:hypothetical protein